MRSKRILVADDEPNIQTMVRVCLETEGYHVASVVNGRQALDELKAVPPDLLLLDLAMPVLDGMSLLAEVHQYSLAPAVRVIVMTAHGSVRAAVQAVRLGASDFLEKPFSPDDLRLSVASVLDETHRGKVEPGATYDDVLAAVRDALRSGRLGAAESLLMTAGTITDEDPCFLNLAGIVHEAHGRTTSARRFYGRSLAADPTYEPAMHNLRRLRQIETNGSTLMRVSLGEDAAVLNLGTTSG